MSRARYLFLAAAFLPMACDAPANVSSPPDFAPAADVSPSPQVHVLNTQLRGVSPPDDGSPASAAWGHLQVKLQDNGDGTFTVDWKGRIFNPAREAITSGQVGIIDPDVEPPPPGTEHPLTPLPILTFFRFAATDAVTCSVIDFDSQGIIDPEVMPAAVANNWIVNPDVHEARFPSAEHLAGAVAGTFGAGTPEGAVDGAKVTGPRVRCSV